MSILDTRAYQMFPVLTDAQIATARRFASGCARQFAPGESLYVIGEQGAPAWLVLEGTVEVVRRDGLNQEAVITTYRAGQLSGEVNQLAGRPSIAAGRAGAAGCIALPFDSAHLRALMIGSADVGEIVMRALILRRVGLIEEGGAGTILIGVPGSPDLVRLQGFPDPHRLSLPFSRFLHRRRRAGFGGANGNPAGRTPPGRLSERHIVEAAKRRGVGGLPRYNACSGSGRLL